MDEISRQYYDVDTGVSDATDRLIEKYDELRPTYQSEEDIKSILQNAINKIPNDKYDRDVFQGRRNALIKSINKIRPDLHLEIPDNIPPPDNIPFWKRFMFWKKGGSRKSRKYRKTRRFEKRSLCRKTRHTRRK